MPQAAFSWKDPTASAVCMAALVALGLAYAALGFPTTTFILACIMVRPAGPPCACTRASARLPIRVRILIGSWLFCHQGRSKVGPCILAGAPPG